MPRHSISYHLYAERDSGVKNLSETNVEGADDALTWKQLNGIENARREVMDRAELPFLKMLSYWSGTCLRALTWDPMIWVTMAIFVGIRVQSRLVEEKPNFIDTISDTSVDILGGFLSFLLVFFVNQTNTRFFDMYKLAKASAGRIQDIAGIAAVEFTPTAANRIVRYMNAAQIAGYVGLGGPYTKEEFFDHLNQKYRLLTEAELARLQPHGDMNAGSAIFKELCTWCQKDVSLAQKSGQIDSYYAVQMHNKVLDLRAAMDGIYDYTDQPTHFFYIHFLCFLSALYLPLFAVDNAYSAGWGDEASWNVEVINGIIVMLQAIFVVGLRILGQRMVDPFGDDLEDLSVVTYVLTTIENCRIITNTQQAREVDDEAEEDMMEQLVLDQHGLASSAFEERNRMASIIEGSGSADSDSVDGGQGGVDDGQRMSIV
eukprot:CAMPEP_0194213620 /NCGR_PEP_ID=MMETSP0156-20130528/14343_1 /TAXON_ID=33649 /ORGANISM="Thalassionema nitzschioides, Strain L26-B" /LENGTH=429 /DNA_ID=CAMNT_0038941693 /DNA_START=29 /DNA_END=1318 /DNA_ORIENTATION=-